MHVGLVSRRSRYWSFSCRAKRPKRAPWTGVSSSSSASPKKLATGRAAFECAFGMVVAADDGEEDDDDDSDVDADGERDDAVDSSSAGAVSAGTSITGRSCFRLSKKTLRKDLPRTRDLMAPNKVPRKLVMAETSGCTDNEEATRSKRREDVEDQAGRDI